MTTIRATILACGLSLTALVTGPASGADSTRALPELEKALAGSATFSNSFAELKTRVDALLQQPIDVPIPKDPGGGYTHERHKSNGTAIYEAGVLFRWTNDAVYANYARDLLRRYAEIYPELDMHPEKKEQTPGRLFWQSLNESVWLVHAIQGYASIRESLDVDEREEIETRLLRPMASFLSDEAPQTFDRIHNHGTWAVAAVGMTGYVLGDSEMVQKSLYGLDQSGEAGFIRQLDLLFSPDGYYSEGPYYQRYALMPFVLFGKSIQENNPELAIFEYRDKVLLKAIYTTIHLSYAGRFFPINDAIREKGLATQELVQAIAIAYGITGDRSLASVAKTQGSVTISQEGLALARVIDQGDAEPFPFDTRLFSDGPNGDQGALAILRKGAGPGHQAIVFKATGQGMGHGHFDKLSWLYYDNGREIIADYGAARFLNVPSKRGGRYLPENESWAKQTVAHNTLVVDERSHFDGELAAGERHHPVVSTFADQGPAKVASAWMRDAYPDVHFHRTLAIVTDPTVDYPVTLDILRVVSGKPHQYDLPLHYKGQVTDVTWPLEMNLTQLDALGDSHGYQHLWLRGSAKGADTPLQVTWLNGDRFYTWTAATEPASELLFVETGANDPEFNLRREPALIWRVSTAEDLTFVSVLEPHGEYDAARETTVGSQSAISAVEHERDDQSHIVHVRKRDGTHWSFAFAEHSEPDQEHQLFSGDDRYEWRGYFKVFGLPNAEGASAL